MTEAEIRAIVQDELRKQAQAEHGLWMLFYRFFMGVACAIKDAKLKDCKAEKK